MKNIILSRKGFDSTSGGKASIILCEEEKRTIIPFFIPQQLCGDSYESLQAPNGDSYRKIFSDLGITHKQAHVDPYIFPAYKKRSIKRGMFGQDGTSQSHLDNNHVDKGDIFLFFGWYKYARKKGDRYSYDHDSTYNNGFHMLYGFLEVGEKKRVCEHDGCFSEWEEEHTHIRHKGVYKKNNTVYVAPEHSSYGFDSSYGLFQYSKELILSQKGDRRSWWKLCNCFRGVTIGNRTPIKEPYCYNSGGRGQEFVINSEKNSNHFDHIKNWATDLIKCHTMKGKS